MQVHESALAHLRNLLTQGEFMRVSIEAGGCQGFAEKFEITQIPNPDDLIIQDCVILDAVSAEILTNATLAYVNEISHKGFQLKVPEATSVCGCGKSFHI